MPFSPPEERPVARVESDVEAIYEILGDIQKTQVAHTRHLRKHDARFDAMDARFDGVDQRFDGVDQRFDGVDAKLQTIDATLTEVLRRLPETGQSRTQR